MPDYLSASGDFTTYGVPYPAGANAVTQASALIDTHLMRPEGLLWASDVTGQPYYMSRAPVQRSWKVQGATSAGASVIITLDSVPPASILGEALVLDRATDDVGEAVTVTAVNGAQITLANVVYAHADQALLELGLILSQRNTVGFASPVAFLARTPVASLICIGTRLDLRNFRMPGLSEMRFGEEIVASGFGVVPNFSGNFAQWTMLDPTIYDCDENTGEVRVSIIGRSNEVRVCYLAGFPETSVPSPLKQACAMLANALMGDDMPTNARMVRAGGTSIEKFAATLIDNDIKRLLKPYELQRGL